jgi:hypothetical protein
VPDEDWEKFVRDCEADRRSQAPKEPSARARIVTERLRALDEQAARQQGRKRGWGRKNAPAEPWQPDGWRTGPAWQEMNGRSARRRKGWGVVGVLLAVAVVVVALKPSAALSLLPGSLGDGFESTAEAGAPVPVTPLAPETGRPSTVPSAASADLPTRERPFAGSPAERWDLGAAAIEVPKAKPVGGVSAERIEAALRRTKEFLVASNLDREVLYGGEPKKALALVDPLAKEYLAELRAGLRRPTVANDPKWTFTRFDPDEVELVGAGVGVRGRMTVESDGGARGKAVIRADYTFVYPLAKVDGGTEVARTIVRRIVEVEVADPVRFLGTEGRIWLLSVNGEIANDLCQEGDGFIHPRFQADLYASPPATGEERDPYDRSRELNGGTDECGTVTRT